ncbi:MAG: S1 RNA-binding domain-containing protein [Epulopiscium sp.]|nr:S1 RNA-binding domain-containing protein [Candidatus Epulonipiscium sp.]
MIRLGEVQKLIIKRFTTVGAYLNVNEAEAEDDILLPKAQLPEDAEVGDKIEVMVYNDSEDRMIATVNRSKLQVGEVGRLKVVSQTRIGSFLDWGLEKDLFLPFSETVGSVELGKEYLVGVYIDKSDRLCATMNIRNFLYTDSPYKANDKVKGTIYNIHPDLGAFVAVEDQYEGLIPKKELFELYQVGDIVEARVTNVQEDGKLDLSLREKAHIQMDKDAKFIVSKLENAGGFLPLNDKSSPAQIKKELNMSKAGFKRAIGRLYKEKLIVFEDGGIRQK